MIEAQMLLPLTQLSVAAGNRRRVIICYQHVPTDDSADLKMKSPPGHVVIRLVDFDRDVCDLSPDTQSWGDEPDTIPVRELLLKAKPRRVQMEIGQRSINLGQIGKEERKTNAITIRNRGEFPLFYILRKSGSALSGDISFRSGQAGIVRGFSTREVEFAYQPSLSGDFSEKITVENVLDPQSCQSVLVKAYVRKPTHFYLKPHAFDFGPCLMGHKAPRSCALMVTNTDYQLRTFVAKVELQQLRFGDFSGTVEFHVARGADGSLDGTGALLSEDAQEKIEALEQKMKIARRKGRSDKVKKLEDKLERLRRGTLDDPDVGEDREEDALDADDENANDPTAGQPGDQTEAESASGISREKEADAPIRALRVTEGAITFTLTGRTTEQVLIEFTPVAASPSVPVPDTASDERCDSNQGFGQPTLAAVDRQTITGTIVVHEHKDVDAQQEIAFQAVVYTEEAAYAEACAKWRAANAVDNSEQFTGAIVTEGSLLAEPVADEAIARERSLSQTSITALSHAQDSANGDRPAITTGDEASQEEEEDEEDEEDEDAGVIEATLTSSNAVAVEEGQTATYAITIANRSRRTRRIQPMMDELSAQEVQVLDLKAVTLDPGEQRTVHMQVRGPEAGWHVLRIPLADSSSGDQSGWRGELVACCYSHPTYLLRFPSLVEEESSAELVLDLGFCYLGSGSKYAQIVPLMVKNTADDDLLVTCQSNLSHQVLVFTDSNCSKLAVDVHVKRHGIVTLWIALQPSMTAAAGRTDARDRDRELRKLIGGIRFSIAVYVPEPYRHILSAVEAARPVVPAGSQILKFTASVGRSTLMLSTTTVNLGWTSVLDEDFYGSLSISNASPRVPAAYQLDCSGGSLSVDRQSGSLAAAVAGVDDSVSAAINFRMNSSRYGLLRETICVTNMHNTHQSLSAEVRLLVDDDRVRIVSMGTTDSSYLAQFEDATQKSMAPSEHSDRGEAVGNGSESERLHALPTLHWPCVPVVVSEIPELTLEANGESPSAAGHQSCEKHAQLVLNSKEHEMELLLQNDSAASITLMAVSDIGQEVRWRAVDTSAQSNIGDFSIADATMADDDKLLVLAPGQTGALSIACADPTLLDAAAVGALERGEQVTTSGLLLVRDVMEGHVVKAVEVTVPYCRSVATLGKYELDFGQVGYVSSWQEVRMPVTFHNQTAMPLPYALQLPACLAVELPNGSRVTEGTLAPLKSVELTIVLDPKLLEEKTPGEQAHKIVVRNQLNADNVLSLGVRVDVTTFEIRFERLHDGELLLPNLHHPAVAAAVPCDAWFRVVNGSFKDVRFEIGAELSPDVACFAKLDVLSRFSNSPLKGGVSLSPNSTIEVRVVASVQRGVRLPERIRQLVTQGAVFTFGKIWVTTQLGAGSDARLTEDIVVRGTVAEARAFSVSEKSMQLAAASADVDAKQDVASAESPTSTEADLAGTAQFVVRNLSSDLDFQFRLDLENPPGVSLADLLDIQPPLSADVGTVLPDEHLTLRCTLRPHQARLPDVIRVRLTDINSITLQTYTLAFRTLTATKHAPAAAGAQRDHRTVLRRDTDERPTRQGSLAVRGCRRIGDDYNRFELNLGQLGVGAQPIMRSIVLHNTSSSPTPYFVRVVPASSVSWLAIGQTRGRLEPQHAGKDDEDNEHTLTITATPIDISVYTAHVVIENPHEPESCIIVRVNMEVVTKQNILRASPTPARPSGPIFTVSANCMEGSEGVIDMPNAFYHGEYVMRSIVIYNHDTVTLPFTVAADLGADPSDIVFSTSRTSAKLFNTLYVDGGHTTRVYIRFRPLPGPSAGAPPLGAPTQEIDAVERKVIRIYVGCRLVKDYQFTVNMRAACRWPTIRVDKDVIDFRGVTQPSGGNIDVNLENSQDHIVVSNATEAPARFVLHNDSTFFSVTQSTEEILLTGSSSVELYVEPRMSVLQKYMKTIRMEKYICEVVSVYNVDRPEERFWITLRITLDQSHYVQAIAVTHISFAYDNLEQRIVEFIRSMNHKVVEDAEQGAKEVAHTAPTIVEKAHFLFRYIVDHLCYYCTIKTGDRFFQLACLFFTMLLTSPTATSVARSIGSLKYDPQLVQNWRRGLEEFLGVFPVSNEKLDDMHNILSTITRAQETHERRRESAT
ncbi:hypothetical protein THASP1DRAFT_31817 [Thamnocephalis sphaerospora]|uniref:Uncharacterized protein n=1 Tax=Thamnocephalis sphaerospora TaxID=78915 RepID=A0A4P9XKS5_9FUNG|nr:hypothetical protein THASP1DRAFT_31817 [Thamnocephalis sphaerospora]|eukprot:RKP06365.1 hypothetical protein THASP1DRAFT_31817 [Thamnocephalis sphaerospora]